MKNKAETYTVKGVSVSPGIAIGPAYIIGQHGVPVPEYALKEDEIEKELKRLQNAISKTQRQLTQLKQKAEGMATGSEDIILLLDAYKGMLAGSRLIRGTEEMIRNDRVNAEFALQRQIAAIKASFAEMDDPYLAARADDVGEVGSRLIRHLLQQHYNPFADVEPGSIVIADEVTPADAALMNPHDIPGFATVLGGAESHAAVMARALGMASVAGMPDLMHNIQNGDTVILDGREGLLIARPDSATLQNYKQELARKVREDRKLMGLADKPSITTDGTVITLQANLELPRDLDMALEVGAAGVGLLRTEFMFMNRPSLPDEDEQYEALKKIVQQLDGKPLTVRTLDVGGEKLATAFGESLGESVNPALGLRAIRIGLREPKLLETQLAAIVRAAAHGPVRILIPMVSSVGQIRQVREHLMQVERRLHRRGVKMPSHLPPLGAMIEIPSAALSADALARVCDFFAIGSNDLTQYTLAIDRGDDRVAELYDPYHPAVLRLIQFTAAAGWRANIPVSLCGEIAGDRRATALLLGLGLRELSMGALRLPAVKQEIRNMGMQKASRFAERIMSCSEDADIHDLIRKGIEEYEEPAKVVRRKS
ncbi:MAG: phosphoenolpyruvate--protein phosphotransferase [Alphaproteobacteria bacterium]|nr:phosphoenolpyruvate--protein phosphotransferase [Alphaproteobacteria bacterium]MBV8548905.1 phosphoenolpyruvate--protein phosphotransferase [Alphaproteobacteria bacterium]